jgi:hypothetical protein
MAHDSPKQSPRHAAVTPNCRSSAPTEITATTGGGAKRGTWHVYVKAPGGTVSRATSSDYSTYVRPGMRSVSPASRLDGGGT